MFRLTLNSPEKVETTVNELYHELDRRITSAPLGNCPVELTSAFLRLCLAQSCGKCVPCRIGLDAMAKMIDNMLDGNADEKDLPVLERTAATIADSSDCAIGYEAARLVARGIAAFRDDYLSHIRSGRCTSNFKSIPCMDGCPAHVDIPGYIALIHEGRYADAVRLIRRDNPFPSVCGLICEHPCEEHCRRAIVDSAINIRGLKRFAIDNAGVVPAPAKAPETGKTVAVVGGGPAGLTAAYFLSLMGHKVTVFESRARLGGMLRYGIPSYRLPDDYLDADIDAILSLGVDVKLNTEIGRGFDFTQLRANYDAVYIAIGAHNHKKLGVDGENARGVISAVQLLRGIGDGQKPDFTGKRVVIIGGGNVAMDVTRTSMRLGAKSVTCVYRRRIEDMTALREEVDGAIAEGCEVMPLMAPVRIETDSDENVTGLVVQPQLIGLYDRGRPKPLKADKPEQTVACDIVIIAIGQAIDSGHFAENGVPVKWDMLRALETGAVGPLKGVFAGGDCVYGPATVIRAIDAGKVAAANIDEYFGTHRTIGVDVEIPHATYNYRSSCGRVNMAERGSEERKDDFDLMEEGMSLEEAVQESSRCLRCDHYGFGVCNGGRKKTW